MRLRLLEAEPDVNAASAKYEIKRKGLFVSRPDQESGFANAEQLASIDNAIDHIYWRVKATGGHFETDSNNEVLAEKILEWAA